MAGLIGIACALIANILIVTFVWQMRNVLREEMSKRGEVVSVQMANNLAFEIFSADTKGLEKVTEATLRDLDDVAFVVIRDARGEVLASKVTDKVQGLTADVVPRLTAANGAATRVTSGKEVIGGAEYLTFSSQALFEQQQDDEAINPLFVGADTSKPKGEATIQRVGVVELGFRVDGLTARITDITQNAALLGSAIFVLCVAAGVFFTRVITVPIERLAKVASGIAGGDLAQKIDVTGNDEIGDLARSFDTMAAGLRSMLNELRGASSEVEREAETVLKTAMQQSAMASEQASAINETSTTMAEIAQTSKQATEHADSVIKIAQKSEELTQDGQKVVEESVTGMENLGEQVKAIALSITDLSERTLQIGDIIATVMELAEQSNLLALIAAIEAAKAGEHGRGFSVVAMEMRNLAEQSKLAAGQVRGILGEVQKGTRAAVLATDEGSKRAQAAIELAQGAGRNIVGLAEVIRDSSLAARQIAGNTRQQTVGVEQIVAAITDLSGAMNDSIAGTKQIEQVSTNLSRLAKQLSELVNRYRIDAHE
ncbi:MAG: methyl-accepting chemotaxis protein [Myxococcaceae bacterium]